MFPQNNSNGKEGDGKHIFARKPSELMGLLRQYQLLIHVKSCRVGKLTLGKLAYDFINCDFIMN